MLGKLSGLGGLSGDVGECGPGEVGVVGVVGRVRGDRGRGGGTGSAGNDCARKPEGIGSESVGIGAVGRDPLRRGAMWMSVCQPSTENKFHKKRRGEI